MGKVRVHCYGCSASVDVDDRLPEQGLKIARWCRSHGETFCPNCAKERGLEDPWGAGVPWAEGVSDSRDAADVVAARDAVPLGPAIEDPQTRVALKRYGRRGFYWLLAGSAMLLATIVFLGIRSSSAKDLLRTGRQTLGLVDYYGSLREGGEIGVRYVADGAVRQGTIYVKERYEPGERVDVIYDPASPSRIRTPQDANESPFATRVVIYGFMFGFLVFGAGIVVLWRPHRWRRLLQAPWRAYAATYIPARRRRAGPGIRLSALGAAAGQKASLRLGGTLRGRAAKLAGESVVWVAGDLDSKVVLAIPGSRELFAAERPRGYIGRQWLAAQKGESKRERRAMRVYTGLIGGVSGIVAITLASHRQWLVALFCLVNAAAFLRVSLRRRRQDATAPQAAPRSVETP